MARISRGINIEDVRGKIGDLVFAGVRGRSVVKRHIQGADRKSDSQLSVRSAFTIVKDSWLSLEAEIINCWMRFAYELKGTGYNFFLSANLGQERADDWRNLTPLNYKVEGVESIEMDPGPVEGESTISWEAGSANPTHKAWAFVREVETGEVVHKDTWRADVSAAQVVVDGLVVGKEYRFYVAVYDGTQDEGDRFSLSQECLGQTETPPEVWFSDGFEDGFNPWTATEVNNEGGGGISISTWWASAGAQSARVVLIDAGAGDYARAKKTGFSIAVGNYIFSSARWYFPSATFDPTANLWLWIITEYVAPFAGLQVALNSSEELWVRDTVNAATYTQGSPISVPLNQEVGIELEMYAHNTEGYIRLRQDGVVIIEQTGIDTQPATNYAHLLMGAHWVDGEMADDLVYYFDEVCIQDKQEIY